MFFSLEGSQVFLEKVGKLFKNTGNPVCVLEKENKVKYHAAASLVSNHMLSLLDTGVSLLEEIGYEREDGYKVFAPLVENNLLGALRSSVEKSLTGPIERGDINTIEKHLECLDGYSKKVYKLLGENVLEIAKRKNSQKEYAEMERIIKQ